MIKRLYTIIFLVVLSSPLLAQTTNVLPGVSINLPSANSAQGTIGVLQIMIGLTILTLAPAILIMMTSFTRMVVVLSFLRQAMGTVNLPPNQLIIGLALLLTFYTMAPTFQVVKTEAIDPFIAQKISQEVAFQNATAPLRVFMMKQTRESDLKLFTEITKNSPTTPDQIPFPTLVASFVLSELKTAFQIGFMLYLPFLVIDLVVASVLMAMGMMMMPPMMISLPLKLLLFVMVDGWTLVVGNLLKSFGAI